MEGSFVFFLMLLSHTLDLFFLKSPLSCSCSM
uniref:Uncharacterized protein n=1 Tax=Rhizophora mucronata TaxID=61149 RepID=A0A2P2QX08_RHIMU